MTDEEMAELYANEYGFGSDFNNITSQEANQAIEQACFAALKVGRPKWHYIKDGDLPKGEGSYIVALRGDKDTYILDYCPDEDNEGKLSWFDSDYTDFNEEVYAWREKITAPKEE